MDIVTYALAKKMASSVASGITEVKTNGTNISFKTAEGEWFTVKLNSVEGATVSATGHLIINLTDGTTIDAGVLPVGPMDTALSATSENGVQNKVVTAALNGKQNVLTAGTGVTIDTTDPANPEISANVDYTKLINKPTKLSDFTDDQGFIDNTVNNLTNYYLKTETYTQTEVNDLISQLTSLSVEIVETLPTENISTTTIYLVNVSGTTNYAQWMYINSAWANIGNTSVDLSNYYTKGQADILLESKVDKVLGKGLSTNDFSNAYKDMLDNYTVDSVLDPSSTNPIQNKTVTDALNTKQPKTLSAPIVVGGVTSSTVESTLGNLNALVDTKLTMVTSLPVSPSNGDAVLYIGTATDGLKTGGIYQYQVSEWVLISYAESFTFNSDDFGIDSSTNEVSLLPSRRVFNGTKADWDLMTTAEKTQYGATAFTDDEGVETSMIVDVVEDGNMNAITSNAVADFAFDKSKIRTGIVSGGSADSDDWYATFDTPFADSNYIVIATPLSNSGAPFCPNGWYTVDLTATGFRLYCSGGAPRAGFQYIAIHN